MVEEAKTQQDITKQHTKKETKRQGKIDHKKKKETAKAHLAVHRSSQI